MSAEYATFGLASAMRAGGVLPDGVRHTHRDFVDFIVDGRPLLFRLSDLDAVSPLASDVPPEIFTAQVRALLLDTPPALHGGRCAIYACPECQSLECGMVTAVVERDGDDVIWRDFAWQTSERADLERDGYPGTGPFRFRGDVYRAALEGLVAGTGPGTGPGATVGTAPRRPRVLLIGARTAVLTPLAAALRSLGIGADVLGTGAARDAPRIPADELRAYGAVAFGRAVGAEERAAVCAALAAAGADAVRVDGLAPIIPLLVAQIEAALDRTPRERRRLTGLSVRDGAAVVEMATAGRVRIVAHRLDLFHRPRSRTVFAGPLEPGEHRIVLERRAVRGGRAHLVARATGQVLVTPVPH